MSRSTRGGRNAIIATIIGALAVAMGVGGLSPAAATQPDMICNEAGFETKVNTSGDPATVPYTAPAGYLVDAYCVKASTEKVIVPVTPPSATVTIDHPNVDSVSHYQVRLVPIPKQTASASVSTLPPTCELGEQLVYGAITNATFSGTANGTYGPGSYAVTATATANAEFSPGVTTDTYNGELAGPLDENDPACVTEEEPTMVPPPVWSPVPSCLDGIQVYPIGEPLGDNVYETEFALSSYVATDTMVTVTHTPKPGVKFFEPGRGDAYTLNEDGTVTVVFDFTSFYEECETPVVDPTQSVSCEAITADYHRPLTNGDHINVTIDPPGAQINMYVDQNVAGGASYDGQNNLGLRWKIFGVDKTPIPLTLEQIESGVITFNYGAELKQLGYTEWTVSFVQTNSTDTWPNKECVVEEEPPVEEPPVEEPPVVDPPGEEEPPAGEEPTTEEPVEETPAAVKPIKETPAKVTTIKHETLAATGFDGTPALFTAGLAFGLVVGGAALMAVRRRASVQ